MTLKGPNIIKKVKINVLISSLMYTIQPIKMAGWQSGYAAACKAVYAGSIPASASINKFFIKLFMNEFYL